MPQPDLVIWTREDGRKVYQLGLQNPPANDDPKRSHHLPPYTDGTMNFADGHYWLTRGTDRTICPFKVIRSPADIVAQRLMFPFGDTGAAYGEVTAIKYVLMGSSSLTKYMPTTGERPDIGLVTDWFAWNMLKGDIGPALEIAQAIESFPIYFLDAATGKFIDLLKYPQANCYESPSQGSPWFSRFPLKPDPDHPGQFVADIGGMDYPQQAHEPEACYGAYMATGDLGFLESLQAVTTFMFLCDAIRDTPTMAILNGEYRGLSWALRNLFMAHVATKDAEARGVLPACCHPSSYWKTLLDNQLPRFANNMLAPDNQVFRLPPGPGQFTPWQVDYMLLVLAFGVLTGHSDWAPLYLWALKNVIDRAIGTRGYPLGMGGGSYFNPAPDWATAVANMFVQSRADGDGRFTQELLDSLIADPFHDFTPVTGFDSSYRLNTRAVLVMAQYLHKLGLIDVKSVYPELDQCFANLDRFVRTTGYMVPRASVVLDASQAPTTIPPLPDPPPTNPKPPTGEITMTDPVFDAAFTATVAFKDNLGNAMVPDQVVWSGPDAFKVAADVNDPLTAHGVYGVAGASVIQAVGTKDGISVTVTKEVTVPEAVPFLASGEITLS